MIWAGSAPAVSVRVDEYMSVETYAHVHHIVSNVSGRLRDGVSPVGVIRALFPGRHDHRLPEGALHGDHRRTRRPRARRLHRFDRLLESRRQLRSQYLDPHHHGARGRAFKFRAGAGIVADSNPAAGTGRNARQGRRLAARPGSARSERRGSTAAGARCIDYRDRGLQYGDGVFETMRVRRRPDPASSITISIGSTRAARGCKIARAARARAASRTRARARPLRSEAVLKLIVTRGHRAARLSADAARERCTRMISLHACHARARRRRHATGAAARLRDAARDQSAISRASRR